MHISTISLAILSISASNILASNVEDNSPKKGYVQSWDRMSHDRRDDRNDRSGNRRSNRESDDRDRMNDNDNLTSDGRSHERDNRDPTRGGRRGRDRDIDRGNRRNRRDRRNDRSGDDHRRRRGGDGAWDRNREREPERDRIQYPPTIPEPVIPIAPIQPPHVPMIPEPELRLSPIPIIIEPIVRPMPSIIEPYPVVESTEYPIGYGYSEVYTKYSQYPMSSEEYSQKYPTTSVMMASSYQPVLTSTYHSSIPEVVSKKYPAVHTNSNSSVSYASTTIVTVPESTATTKVTGRYRAMSNSAARTDNNIAGSISFALVLLSSMFLLLVI